MSHRYLAVAGNSYRRGELIGKNWSPAIITILKSIENAASSKDGMTLHQWLPHAKTFLPFIREYASNTLEEMEGDMLRRFKRLKEIGKKIDSYFP